MISAICELWRWPASSNSSKAELIVLNDGKQAQPRIRESTRASSSFSQGVRWAKFSELVPFCIEMFWGNLIAEIHILRGPAPHWSSSP
jgi:hypothetical protein